MKGPNTRKENEKPTGTERKKKIREEQETQQKTKKIVQYVAGAVLTVAGIIGGYHFLKSDPKEPGRPNTPQPVATRSAEDIELRKKYQCRITESLRLQLNAQELKAIEDAFYLYVKVYGSPLPVIEFDSVNLSGEETVGEITVEVSTPGRVELDIQMIKRAAITYQMDPNVKLKNTIKHALTHACCQRDPTKIKPIILPDGARFYAIEAFSPLVELNNGEKSGFRMITEGAAEMLASQIDNNYGEATPEYDRLKDLMSNITKSYKISANDLAKMVQSNELEKFLKRIFGKDTISVKDYVFIMECFQKRNTNEKSTESIMKDIETYNKKTNP